jgi:hypothetical protein
MEDHIQQMRRRILLSIVPIALLRAAPLAAETLPVGRRIAISGYDPVAYFTEGQPQKGSEAFWFPFDDAVYLFKSTEHRAQFAADPERYAPQYAGFCAAGVSKGYKAEPDPEAWAILNGKLYLFQLKDRVPGFKQDTAFIDKANSNWPGLMDAPIQ